MECAPVSSRASSSFLPADWPNSSIDSLRLFAKLRGRFRYCLKVVTMFLQGPGPFSSRGSNGYRRARWPPLRTRGRQAGSAGAAC